MCDPGWVPEQTNKEVFVKNIIKTLRKTIHCVLLDKNIVPMLHFLIGMTTLWSRRQSSLVSREMHEVFGDEGSYVCDYISNRFRKYN